MYVTHLFHYFRAGVTRPIVTPVAITPTLTSIGFALQPTTTDSSNSGSSEVGSVLYPSVGTVAGFLVVISVLVVAAIAIHCAMKQKVIQITTQRGFELEMATNEAYTISKEAREAIEIHTSQNEVYSTVVSGDHNTVPLSENEVYPAANIRSEVTTSQNQAYGAVYVAANQSLVEP